MADEVNITSEDDRSDDGNGKGKIACASNKVLDLLDDDDDDEKKGTIGIMKEVYYILPQREDLSSPEGWTPKKLKICTTMYLRAPVKHCFLELDLEIFSNWYAKLPLSKLIDYHKRVDCNEVWEYSVILLHPKMLMSCPDQSKRKRYNWAKDAVSAF